MCGEIQGDNIKNIKKLCRTEKGNKEILIYLRAQLMCRKNSYSISAYFE